MPEESIRRLESLVQGALRPDLTLLLDVPVNVGLERARSRRAVAHDDADRFERERTEFFERVRRTYIARAAAEPLRIAVIDAARGIEAVAADIRSELTRRRWIS
jgi:dTMP kinase